MIRPPELLKKSIEQARELRMDLLAKGDCGGQELTRAVGLNFLLFNHFIEGGVIPTVQSVSSINRDISESFLEMVRGNKRLPAHLHEMRGRLRSGVKYEKLINSLGKELFGSARFEGEQLLASNDFFTLSYLPPSKDVPKQKAALFHCGGFLPFSDRLFRFLPESNLFTPFLERGIGVYVMELKGTKADLPSVGACTLERYIDVVSELSGIAHKHNAQNPLVLEGYCGLAMQAVSYLAAKPEEADQRFNVAFTMVAPVDGSKCEILDDMISTVPRHMITAQNAVSELFGGAVSGDSIRMGMDIPLNSFFHKTSFGRFVAGWNSGQYGEVKQVDDLSAGQRKEMAGAYWISPENANLFPMPVDISSFASRLWTESIADGHKIPYRYKGVDLSLQAIRERTQLQVAGFYGGKDKIVPDDTAHPLQKTLGDRYTHVVHPKAGHISYVLSPQVWDTSHAYALTPNPIDLVLKLYDKRQQLRAKN